MVRGKAVIFFGSNFGSLYVALGVLERSFKTKGVDDLVFGDLGYLAVALIDGVIKDACRHIRANDYWEGGGGREDGLWCGSNEHLVGFGVLPGARTVVTNIVGDCSIKGCGYWCWHVYFIVVPKIQGAAGEVFDGDFILHRLSPQGVGCEESFRNSDLRWWASDGDSCNGDRG
jgi:hypothetical protein